MYVCITKVDLNVNTEETNNMYTFHYSEWRTNCNIRTTNKPLKKWGTVQVLGAMFVMC